METFDDKITINFWLLAVFFAVVLGSASLGVLYMTRANSIVKTKIVENKETVRPANIDAVVINDQNCKDCFDVTPLLDNMGKANIKLTSRRTIDRGSDEAKTFISQYSIEKLPTLILRGEVQKNADMKALLSQAGTINGDTFILRVIGGPFVTASSGEIKGRTELILIGDASCAGCYDMRQHQSILSRFGLTPAVKSLDANSTEAKSLIKKYSISLLPTFILTGDVKEYPALTKIWPQVGNIKEGAHVFTKGVSLMGVYKDLRTGKIINPAQNQGQSSAATGR